MEHAPVVDDADAVGEDVLGSACKVGGHLWERGDELDQDHRQVHAAVMMHVLNCCLRPCAADADAAAVRL